MGPDAKTLDVQTPRKTEHATQQPTPNSLDVHGKIDYHPRTTLETFPTQSQSIPINPQANVLLFFFFRVCVR